MLCPFCAEEIKEPAIVCRFCGASREDGDWRRSPGAIAGPGKPGWMLRASGALLLLGAAFELMQPTSPVPLFGELRVGSVAVTYHLVFASLFAWVGIGLWRGTPWAYRATVVATIVYSLDRASFLLDTEARYAQINASLGNNPMIRDMIDVGSADRLLKISAGVAIVGFWGLFLLVHRRRAELAAADDAP